MRFMSVMGTARLILCMLKLYTLVPVLAFQVIPDTALPYPPIYRTLVAVHLPPPVSVGRCERDWSARGTRRRRTQVTHATEADTRMRYSA